MATKKLNSIKGRRTRVTRLSNLGVPVVGACSKVVSRFLEITWEPQHEEGEQILERDAWGDQCVNHKDGDIVTGVDVSLRFCDFDPDLMDIVGGANPLIHGGNTIGASFPMIPNPDAFAVEVWTMNVDNPAEWGYAVFPFISNGKVEGAATVNNGKLNITLTGTANAAVAAWGTGPHGDNPLLLASGMPVGDSHAIVTTTVVPPALTTGCAAVS